MHMFPQGFVFFFLPLYILPLEGPYFHLFCMPCDFCCCCWKIGYLFIYLFILNEGTQYLTQDLGHVKYMLYYWVITLPPPENWAFMKAVTFPILCILAFWQGSLFLSWLLILKFGIKLKRSFKVFLGFFEHASSLGLCFAFSVFPYMCSF